MEVFLEHLKGERAGALDRFTRDVIRVGRAAELDLIFEDAGVSFEHAELRLRDGDFWLVDLGSTNGSFVNEERAQNARLREGDQVRFGKKGPVVRFRLSAPPGAPISNESAPDGRAKGEGVLIDLPPLAPKVRTRPRALTTPEMAALQPSGPRPAVPRSPSGRQPRADQPCLDQPLPLDSPSGASDSAGDSGSSAASSNSDPHAAAIRRSVPIVVRASRTTTVLAVFLAFAAVITGSLATAFWLELGRKSQLYQDEVDHSEQLKKELSTLKRTSAERERELEARLRDEAREERERLEAKVEKAHRAERESSQKLEDLTARLARAQRDLSQMSAAGTQQNNRMWKVVESRVARSVVLVFCQFDLRHKDGSTERFQCSGSGFFISKDGHLVTNKHVVEPWKFRPLAIRMVQEELEVDTKSYKLAVWIAGTRFADGSTLLVGNGYSTDQGTLERLRTPPDRWTNLTLPGDKGIRLMKIHDDMSNEDLALLKAKGGVFEPIPLRRPSEGVIEKLDPVLLVGFPAGASILEKGIAETSVVPGVVRKVEETIYVSGGMIGGNSGGPVLDSEGRAVGVATRVVSGTESFGSCLKIEHVIELFEGGSW